MNRSTLLTIALTVVIGGVVIGAWIWVNLPTQTSNPEEIRVYNGQQLNSVNDFRNEAINGNQDINISTYTLTITGLVQNEVVLSYDQT